VIAIVFSLFLFVMNGAYPQISELQRVPGTTYYLPVRASLSSGQPTCTPTCSLARWDAKHDASSGVMVLRFESALWFANATRLSDRIKADMANRNVLRFALDMSTVPWVDATAGTILSKLYQELHSKGGLIRFGNTNPPVKHMIQKACHAPDSDFLDSLFDAEDDLARAAAREASRASASC